MAYSKFTSLVKFCHQYGVTQNTQSNLFKGIELPSFDISAFLLNDVEEAKTMPIYSEKAKSELLISPILKELKRKNKDITIFSGFSLNIESDLELQGSPDFVLCANANSIEIESPIFCLMESKNKTPDEGFAQCAAEMYAARLFNQQMNDPHEIIYGGVTNAYEWVFMKLEGSTLYIDTERYFLSDLVMLLKILQTIVNFGKNKP